jgi:hypothetical protein
LLGRMMLFVAFLAPKFHLLALQIPSNGHLIWYSTTQE